MKQREDLAHAEIHAPRQGRNLLLKLAALAVLAFGLRFALNAVFAPWAFFMGGHFHLNPKWAGWGRMHSNTSGDYAIYITISPSFGRGQSYTDITGKGALCTQRGDSYRLSMAGSFEKGSGADLQGRSATLYPHNYDRKHTGHNDPSLEFRGKWNNPDLVLDDQGSLNRVFDPDGGLAKKKRSFRRSSWPGELPPSKAEYICADLSSRPQLFLAVTRRTIHIRPCDDQVASRCKSCVHGSSQCR